MEDAQILPIEPLKNMPKKIYIEGIHDDYEGFRIILSGVNQSEGMIRLASRSPLVYRSAQESGITGIPIPLVKDWWLYKLIDSPFIRWFSEVSYHKDIGTNINHFCIYTENQFVDILSDVDLEVEWLVEPSQY